MARESRPTAVNTTPARQAPNADPSASTARPPIAIRTPGSQGRGLRQTGLSASGRKPAPGPNATPHARAAFRAIDSRRAAIFTPHRTRRRSLREVRETPRDFLLSLGKVLARNTETITTSSSSPGSNKEPSSESRLADTILEDDDDEEEELPKRPRLSLPIDVEDEDDSPLRPHRSAGLEDENFTIQSIELPRRAISEQPGGRNSLGSVRMSDYYFNPNELRSEDVGIDSGFFPPTFDDDVEFETRGGLLDYDRLDSDAVRADMGRESDFGAGMTENINESTFLMAPQIQDSPTHQALNMGEPMSENELLEPRSDEDDDEGNQPMEDWPLDDDENEPIEEDWPLDGGEVSSPLPAADRDPTITKVAMLKGGAKKRGKKISKYGIEYPSLPPAVVKRLAQTFAKTSGAKGKITPDALQAIMQASEWFFEQLGDDLQAYATHAHRKTIDESDMLTLMKRYVY